MIFDFYKNEKLMCHKTHFKRIKNLKIAFLIIYAYKIALNSVEIILLFILVKF